jgi:hypothetical protein
MKQAALPILVLLVIVCLAIVAALPSASVEADHYQRFRDGKSLYTLLSGSISRGFTLQDVEDVIGSGIPLVEDVELHRGTLRETAMWHPDLFPDGVFNEDTFRTWSGNDEKVTLQFRNGYLINFAPEQFTTWQPSYDVAGQTDFDSDFSTEPELTIAGQETLPTPLIRPQVVSAAGSE